MTKWSTEKQDIAIAKDVMIHHYEDFEDVMGLQEVMINEDGTCAIERTDWIVELEERYINRYGDRKGRIITNKVITRLLLNDDVIH